MKLNEMNDDMCGVENSIYSHLEPNLMGYEIIEIRKSWLWQIQDWAQIEVIWLCKDLSLVGRRQPDKI